MKFSESTKQRSRFRQRGKCVHCNESLDWQEEFAHHLYPHALGGADCVDNCVVLCGSCHYRVHNDGRFRSGIVAPRDYFPYMNASRTKV